MPITTSPGAASARYTAKFAGEPGPGMASTSHGHEHEHEHEHTDGPRVVWYGFHERSLHADARRVSGARRAGERGAGLSRDRRGHRHSRLGFRQAWRRTLLVLARE